MSALGVLRTLVLAALVAGCDSGRPLPQLDAGCPVTLPAPAALEQWHDAMLAAQPQLPLKNWTYDDQYEGADIELRRLATFSLFCSPPSDDDTDLFIPQGRLVGLWLVQSSSAQVTAERLSHIEACTGLDYIESRLHPATPPFSLQDREYHYFHGPGLSLLELAWLADFLVLEHADVIIFAGDWRLAHGQGIGGGI